jgi:hypothetical protein
MSKNVLIPQSTFEKIIELFECVEFSRLANFLDYVDVYHELKFKQQRLDIRKTYAKVIAAKDDRARDNARMNYLHQRRQIGKIDDSFSF